MAFPENIALMFERLSPYTIDGKLNATAEMCVGAKYHSPTPLVVHEVPLNPADPESEVVTLCGSCRDNLAIHQYLLERSDGELPWAVRREFGNLIRATGEKAWAARNPRSSDE